MAFRVERLIKMMIIADALSTKAPELLTAPPHLPPIASCLSLPKKFLVSHDGLIRMPVAHVRNVGAVFGHTYHQPQALAGKAKASLDRHG
jgi:hypothetical protein